MRIAVLLSILVALPSTAGAQSAAEEVAAKASQAHDTHCAEVAGTTDEGAAALAIGQVSAVWAEVTQVYEATGETWLMYWRGVLAQCLRQDDRAAEALVEFVESDTAAKGLAAMARDARKRLGRLLPDYVPPKPERPPPTPDDRQRASRTAGGILLALGAAGAGVGSGVGFGQVSATRSVAEGALHTRAEADALIVQGNGQVGAGVGLGVGAGVAAVASIAAFAAKGSVKVEVAVVPVPLTSGVVIAVGGRW